MTFGSGEPKERQLIARRSEIVLYHDEMKSVPNTALCGHVVLFIPRRQTVRADGGLFGAQEDVFDPGATLLAELKRIRAAHGAREQKFHFTNVSGKRWMPADLATLECLEAGMDALRSRRCIRFPAALHCKVAVFFYPRDGNPAQYGGDRKERRYRYDETALRMPLKGVLNGLYDAAHHVTVRELISDGVAEHRPLDVRRVLLQLLAEEAVGRTPLRPHVEIESGVRVRPVSSDHKAHVVDSEDYDHAHFLQLADLFLGAFARAAYGTNVPLAAPRVGTEIVGGAKKDVLMRPAWELLEKVGNGAIHGSARKGAFAASELAFERGNIVFKDLSVRGTTASRRSGGQQSLGF